MNNKPRFLDEMPEFISTKDLVELGLFKNLDAVYLARIRGIGPNYFKLGRKVMYRKKDVKIFIERNFFDGDIAGRRKELNFDKTTKGE